MTIRKVYLGTVGPFLYDDAELIGDADGDFAGSYYKGIVTDGQMIVSEPPTQPGHVLRQEEAYDPDGGTEDITIVTGIQAGGGGAIGFQYKTRTLSIDNGIVKTIGAESGWSDI
jgi:hypothetical protein